MRFTITGSEMVCVRLCVVRNGSSRRISWGTAHGAGEMTIDLHYTSVELKPGDILRVAVSTSYFPMFLPLGSDASVTNLELNLPTATLAPLTVAVPPETVDSTAARQTSLRRVRSPRPSRSRRRARSIGSRSGTTRRSKRRRRL